jgi:hypothetical protein
MREKRKRKDSPVCRKEKIPVKTSVPGNIFLFAVYSIGGTKEKRRAIARAQNIPEKASVPGKVFVPVVYGIGETEKDFSRTSERMNSFQKF